MHHNRTLGGIVVAVVFFFFYAHRVHIHRTISISLIHYFSTYFAASFTLCISQKMENKFENYSIWSEIVPLMQVERKRNETLSVWNEIMNDIFVKYSTLIHLAMIFNFFSLSLTDLFLTSSVALHLFESGVWLLFLCSWYIFLPVNFYFSVSFSCKFENKVRYINCVTSYWRQF